MKYTYHTPLNLAQTNTFDETNILEKSKTLKNPKFFEKLFNYNVNKHTKKYKKIIKTTKTKNYTKYLYIGVTLSIGLASVPASAEVTESSVKQYAKAMKKFANSKNIQGVSSLIADDVIIKLTRNNNFAVLNKAKYLKLLQHNWKNNSNYKYSIKVSNIVVSGKQAKVKVITKESFVENGKSVVHITESKATFKENNNKAVLLRSVSQVSIN